jgi:hypothetical protein
MTTADAIIIGIILTVGLRSLLLLRELHRAYAAVTRAVRHAKALEEDRDLQERMLKDVLALATFEDEEVADALFDVYLAGRQSLVRRYPDLVE